MIVHNYYLLNFFKLFGNKNNNKNDTFMGPLKKNFYNVGTNLNIF